MRKLAVFYVAVVLLLATVSVSQAAPVPITLEGKTLVELLGTGYVSASDFVTTPLAHDELMGEVISQAFTDGAGNYAYLYQIRNTGSTGNSAIEAFTCSPFLGAFASTTLGYLTDNLPAGFTLGEQAAAGASVDAVVGPTVSFMFPAWLAGQAIDPGEASNTLYILSDGMPGMITGNLINGTTTSGQVVGPIPEPATICLLSLGGLLLCKRKRS